MRHANRSAVKPVVAVLAAVLATATVVNTSSAATGGVSETIEITGSSQWGDPGMAKIAVDSGRALIDHLRSARALLDTGKLDEARSALIASREFADAINRTMPYLTVVQDMMDASNEVVQEDVAALSADLLPIYASLDELQVYTPHVVNLSRASIHTAGKNAASRHRQRAATGLKVTADDITQHTVYLPVTYVDEQVHGALYALDRPQPDVVAAKAAVQRALESVTTVVDEVVSTAT